MPDFVHQRHKPPTSLERPRELVLVCAPLRSSINLSRIVRTASCCGVSRLIACGPAKIDTKIARVTSEEFPIEKHRSLAPVLKKLGGEGYQLVGLEQTTNSQNLHAFSFVQRTAIVVGNERLGLTEDVLALLDHVVEIPVYGLPFSYNVATATTMALYEYCRQFPTG
ncbi:MAG: RNA methyltransferase [Planctomycetia bacterium]|nr:RNA methyltransferase [Planctomycetia bacterium]